LAGRSLVLTLRRTVHLGGLLARALCSMPET